jgi:hypothetical protein
MKALVSILGIVAVLATAAPAAAQMKGGKKGHSHETGQPKKKADDKGYKSASSGYRTKNSTRGARFVEGPRTVDPRNRLEPLYRSVRW